MLAKQSLSRIVGRIAFDKPAKVFRTRVILVTGRSTYCNISSGKQNRPMDALSSTQYSAKKYILINLQKCFIAHGRSSFRDEAYCNISSEKQK